MPEPEQWEPLDVQRIAKQTADSIDALYGHIDAQTAGVTEDIIKKLLLEERAFFERILKNPVVVRVNMMRGGIARPSDLVWLHDTDGPVVEKVRKAVEEQIEKDAVFAESARIMDDSDAVSIAMDISMAIRNQKRKK